MALTANHTIKEWLEDPKGGELLRGMLAQGGQDAEALAPVYGLPLQQLVVLSQGKMPQEAVDGLVLAANDGVMPEETGPVGWVEVVTPGRFAGQTLVVTGAAGGIGKCVASRIVREGGRVVGVDISAEKLAATAAELGASFVAVAGDITNDDDVARIVAAADGRIHGLANVAGIMDDFAPVGEVSDGLWDRVMAVNVTGPFKLMRAIVPGMAEAGGGTVVNVTSEAGLRGAAAGCAYTTSKHAVIGLTKSTATMYGPDGVRTNAVAPGGVATGIPIPSFNEKGMGRLRPFHETSPAPAMPEALAASITFLLSDDSVNINGAILPSDGGWSAS